MGLISRVSSRTYRCKKETKHGRFLPEHLRPAGAEVLHGLQRPRASRAPLLGNLLRLYFGSLRLRLRGTTIVDVGLHLPSRHRLISSALHFPDQPALPENS